MKITGTITGVLAISFCLLLLYLPVDYTIKLNNRAGQNVYYIQRPGRELRIRNRTSTVISHESGALNIRAEDGTKWHYGNISVRDNHKLARRVGLIIHQLRLYLLLDRDGVIYLLPKNLRKGVDYRDKQPPGFPLHPEPA